MPNPYKKGTKKYEEAEKRIQAAKKRKRKGGKLMGGRNQRRQLEALERD